MSHVLVEVLARQLGWGPVGPHKPCAAKADTASATWRRLKDPILAVLKAKTKIKNLSESGRNRPKTYVSLTSGNQKPKF